MKEPNCLKCIRDNAIRYRRECKEGETGNLFIVNDVCSQNCPLSLCMVKLPSAFVGETNFFNTPRMTMAGLSSISREDALGQHVDGAQVVLNLIAAVFEIFCSGGNNASKLVYHQVRLWE